MDSSIISIIIVLITMGLFVWNRLPISVVAILGSVAMAMFIPEMDLSAVYSGFSATGWPMVVGMCVVSAALFETGIARKIGEKIGNSFLAKTERRFIVTVSAVCSLMSAFMSNNGTVAIWMPIIAIVAANSCGKSVQNGYFPSRNSSHYRRCVFTNRLNLTACSKLGITGICRL